MIFVFLASAVERFLNWLAPSRVDITPDWLADVEADREVFAPNELGAAVQRQSAWACNGPDTPFEDCPACTETPEEGSPRAAATAGGVDTKKGQPVPDSKITELRRLLKQAEEDDRTELAHLRAENAALRAAIAKMEARPIPYRIVEVSE